MFSFDELIPFMEMRPGGPAAGFSGCYSEPMDAYGDLVQVEPF